MSSFFRRSTDSPTDTGLTESSSSECVDEFITGNLEGVFSFFNELIKLSDLLIMGMNSIQETDPEKELLSFIELFQSLQSSFATFTNYFEHMKEAFHCLQLLQQRDKVKYVLNVFFLLTNFSSVLIKNPIFITNLLNVASSFQQRYCHYHGNNS